jgi:hypothetical protein
VAEKRNYPSDGFAVVAAASKRMTVLTAAAALRGLLEDSSVDDVVYELAEANLDFGV